MKVKNLFIYKMVACITALFIFSLSMSYYAPNAIATNTNRSYYIYSPSGDFIDSYTLNAVSNYSNTRKAIGSDDRVIDYSKTGVVKLIDSNSGVLGSGFVIGNHLIATAAHCLYDKLEKEYNHNPIIGINQILLFDTSGNITSTIAEEDILEFHIPYNYINAPTFPTNDPMSERFYYDYALIYVKENLSNYVMFDFGTMLNNFNSAISITGFPVEVNGAVVNNTNNLHTKYTGNGQVTAIYNSTFKTNADASSGNSGGPAYVTTQYNGKTYYTVIGILVAQETGTNTTYNLCNKITTDQLHFFKDNPYI